MRRVTGPERIYHTWPEPRRRRKLAQLKRKYHKLAAELVRVRSHLRHLERSLQ